MIRRYLRSERGVGWLTMLVFGSIVGAVGYAAYHILPFYYYYYDLRNQFVQMIRIASVETDETIRQRLMYFIKKYDIPCDPEDLRIERVDDSTMRISLQYKEVFYVTWQGKDYTIHTFDFDATVEEQFK